MAVFSGMANAQINDPNLGIIPAPVSVKKGAGQFILSQQTVLLADSVTNKAVVFLADYLQNKAMLKVQLKTNDGSNPANTTGTGAHRRTPLPRCPPRDRPRPLSSALPSRPVPLS